MSPSPGCGAMQDMHYSAPSHGKRGEQHVILKGVTGYFAAGQMTALVRRMHTTLVACTGNVPLRHPIPQRPAQPFHSTCPDLHLHLHNFQHLFATPSNECTHCLPDWVHPADCSTRTLASR